MVLQHPKHSFGKDYERRCGKISMTSMSRENRYGKRNRDHAELLIGVKAIATKNSPDFGSFYQNKRLAVNEHLTKLRVEKLKRQDSRMGIKK